ncbi:type IV toxin-antitoxin system AbiEi family antitoxin domain-containing protein [Cryobacterium sp. M23]|uniref:type IV toxin-antitoxin system AbiEi family antitoxin domain-containing protein n=1 Tax=Cryobacterium sp. M23 TaxID=2048292 RepID=UPI000CE355E4|nr:type IV toxin-antitoxin system AbiEi family antitoxin domain-containing protein [Cryobacterium sp. M23]
MTKLLDIVSARFDGLVTYAALRERGLNSHSVDALIRRGELVRTRRSIYVSGELRRSADPDQRYRPFVLSTVAAAGRPLVLSHASAASTSFLVSVVMIDHALQLRPLGFGDRVRGAPQGERHADRVSTGSSSAPALPVDNFAAFRVIRLDSHPWGCAQPVECRWITTYL